MIDPNKTYRTQDGRAVRIYAEDNGVVHGAVYNGIGWFIKTWDDIGSPLSASQAIHDPGKGDLIEVTLADELRDQIPWEALRPSIRWVAMSPTGVWFAWESDVPPVLTKANMNYWLDPQRAVRGPLRLDALDTPWVNPRRWQETLVERPGDR